MDITNLHANQLGDRKVKGGTTTDATADTASQSAEASDVQLSDQARAIAKLVDSVAEQPAFDTQRVSEIRAAIAQGDYHVDPERLAASFMNLENLLDQ